MADGAAARGFLLVFGDAVRSDGHQALDRFGDVRAGEPVVALPALLLDSDQAAVEQP